MEFGLKLLRHNKNCPHSWQQMTNVYPEVSDVMMISSQGMVTPHVNRQGDQVSKNKLLPLKTDQQKCPLRRNVPRAAGDVQQLYKKFYLHLTF